MKGYGTWQAISVGAGGEPASTDRSAVGNGKTTAQTCKEASVVEQTYFRWRKVYGGLRIVPPGRPDGFSRT